MYKSDSLWIFSNFWSLLDLLSIIVYNKYINNDWRNSCHINLIFYERSESLSVTWRRLYKMNFPVADLTFITG